MRKLLLLALLLALPKPAHSQPSPAPQIQRVQDRSAPAEPPPGEGRRPHRRLFISPSGEPFRGPNGLAAWFAQADADHDGAITSAEFQADAGRAFMLYDSDGDGVLNGLEIQAYERERVPELGEFIFGGGEEGGGRGGRRGPGRRRDGGAPAEARPDKGPPDETVPFRGAGSSGAARFSLLNEPEPLLAADQDVDGKVTRAEWSRAATRRFALLDRDHAGRLTLAGLQASTTKH